MKIELESIGTIHTEFTEIEVSEPGVITALITKESAEKLGLKEGDDVTAIIKSTEVIIGK